MVRRFIRDTYYTTREFSENARLFLFSTFLSWTGFSVSQVLFNLYLTEGGYGEAFAGRCAALTGLGMGLTAFPASFLADRIGRRMTLLCGSFGLGVVLLLRPLTLDANLLLAASFFAGSFQALVSISASPFMSENSESHVRTHLFSAHFVAVLTAGILGNLAGGAIPEFLREADWIRLGSWLVAYRWTLVAGAALTTAAIWPLFSVREVAPELVELEEPPLWQNAGRTVRNLALNYLLIGCGAGLIMPFFNLYFANRFQCTSGQIGFFFAASQVFTIVAALIGPRLARRYGMLPTIVCLQLASLPFLVTLGFESTLMLAVLAFWARASLMQASSPLQNALTMELVPKGRRNRVMGLCNTLWQLGWAMTSSGSGWVLANVGYEYPYYLTALFYGLASVHLYFAFRRDPAARQATPPVKPYGR